jgi:hypothetical protein
MIYLLDANVLLEAKDRYYGFDIVPAFWEWLLAENVAHHIFSIESVRDELLAKSDQLAEWALARGTTFFLSPDQAVVDKLGALSEWVTKQSYTQAAVDAFLGKADYWLVAHAWAYSGTVVTHERWSEKKSKVKIPNACAGVGVPCMNCFELLRALGARFVLPDS